MFVIHRADLDAASGPHPTVLYGYGGFQVSQVPAYSATVAAWVERGGVWAVACIRGGSEEGEAWHRDGMREHKQHCFDDFIAAGEALTAAGWTAPERLGIYGGSNGGLLVGATLTQRPDLDGGPSSAPLPCSTWSATSGSGSAAPGTTSTAPPPTRRELGWLLSYSPYHRVVAGTAYPGRPLHGLRQRHPGRPAPRPQALRRPPVGHQPPVGGPDPAAAGGERRPRRPVGQPHDRPRRRRPGLLQRDDWGERAIKVP